MMTEPQADPVLAPSDLEPVDPLVHPKPKERPLTRHRQVHEQLPPGFVRYRGNGNPFKDGALIELAIRVRPVGSEAKDAAEAHVMMIAGPKRAWLEGSKHPKSSAGVQPSEWAIPASEFGSIAGTRLINSSPPEMGAPA